MDKKLWDWTVPAWVILMYYRVKLAQVKNPTPEYARALFFRFMELWGPRCRIRLPTGKVLRQTVIGIMKSGCYFTTSCNSMAQFAQHVLAWIRSGFKGPPPLLWAMGDDAIMEWLLSQLQLEEYLKQLATTGCLVKHALRRREFAGFELVTNDVARPLYPAKHQFMMRYVEPELEQQVLLQFALLNALDRDSWFKKVRHLCEFPVGEQFVLWAKGLLGVSVLDGVWDLFKP